MDYKRHLKLWQISLVVAPINPNRITWLWWVKKVMLSHARFQVLGPELILVYRQSARRWLSHPPGGKLPLLSAKPVVSSRIGPVLNYTAWWHRHMQNSGSNLLTTDIIDTKTEICTSQKSDLYFRFHGSPSIMSTLIDFYSIWNFVLIHWKMVSTAWKLSKLEFVHVKNWISSLFFSEIGDLWTDNNSELQKIDTNW